MLRGVLRPGSAPGTTDPAASSSSGGGPVLPPRPWRRVQRPTRHWPIGGQPSRIVCGAGVAHPGEEQAGSSDLFAALSVPVTAMAKNLSSSGGSAVLQKPKLDLSRKAKPMPPKTDDAGGGGDIGKIIFNGGGGGGDDDDDDDDYYEEEDGGDGDGDDGFFRKVLPQLYDRVTISAVLEEWFRSFADLPTILRRAVEMGLFSSAQLVRFCSMDVRPGLFRGVSRKLPVSMSRSFVGRLMADPAFAQKLLLENVLTISASIIYELQTRGEHFSQELDLVTINTLSFAAATSTVVWMLSPSRSFNSVKTFPWQRMLETLPNNIFDTSGPLRNYTSISRAASMLTKLAELSAVGALIGSCQAFLSQGAVALRQRTDPSFEPSVSIPGVERSLLGMGAFVGLNAHLRYQVIGGIDRYLFDHSSFLWSYLAASSLFRIANVSVAETSRPWFQGLPSRPQKRTSNTRARVDVHTQYEAAVPAKTRSGKKKSKGYELSIVNATP